MATATAPNDLNLPNWPTGPVERRVMRELDHTEMLSALRDARDALARRRA